MGKYADRYLKEYEKLKLNFIHKFENKLTEDEMEEFYEVIDRIESEYDTLEFMITQRDDILDNILDVAYHFDKNEKDKQKIAIAAYLLAWRMMKLTE